LFFVTEQKKKPGRKRKAAPAEDKSEDSTTPDVKKNEAAKEEEPKEEPKIVSEEKLAKNDASQPSKTSQVHCWAVLKVVRQSQICKIGDIVILPILKLACFRVPNL